jgi:hypothetical protein
MFDVVAGVEDAVTAGTGLLAVSAWRLRLYARLRMLKNQETRRKEKTVDVPDESAADDESQRAL